MDPFLEDDSKKKTGSLKKGFSTPDIQINIL